MPFDSPNGVTCHLEVLARKGWIEKDLADSRGIRLTTAALQPTGDGGLDLSQELRKRDVDIAALRRRLEAADKLRECLEERVRRAEGLAAAVRQTVARLESFLVLEAGRQPAKAEGLEAALSLLRVLLGFALGAAQAAEAPAISSARENKAALPDPGKGVPAVKLDLSAYEKIPAEKFSWGWIRWLMNAKIDPKAEMTMGLVYLEANKSNPLHVHPNATEVLHVLSGSCEHRVGERYVKLRTGDTLRIPQATPHQARTGNEPCLVLVIYNTGTRQMVLVPEGKPKR